MPREKVSACTGRKPAERRPTLGGGNCALRRKLSPAQTAVLRYTAAGFSAKEIARARCCGTRTIETHVERIRGKLGAVTKAHAVDLAWRAGILP